MRQTEAPGTKASAISTSPRNRVTSPAVMRSCARLFRREFPRRVVEFRLRFAIFALLVSLSYKIIEIRLRYFSILSLYHGKSQIANYFSIS